MSISEIMNKEDFKSLIDTYIGIGGIIGRVIQETSPDDMQGIKARMQKLAISCNHMKSVVQKRWEDLNVVRECHGVPGSRPEGPDGESGPADADEA